MQKKLLAVALAGAFGAPAVALAQSSTVQVFGTLYVEYTFHASQEQVTAFPGSQRSTTDFIQTPGSEIGFKGEEKLGGGLSAWFQCASTADVRGQSQNGWCSRNSAVGLKGGFGNVFVGNWDTPFKRTISPTVVGGNDTGIWGTAFLLTGDSTTDAVGANRFNFKKRQNNLITYDSPTFAGFQVMAAFTSSGPSTGTLASASNAKPRVYSLGGQYSAGPLYVSAGYEQHRQYAGAGPIATNESKDDGWHVGAAYTWGPVRFGGQFTRQNFEFNPLTGGTSDVQVTAWHAGVDWTIVGPHGLRAAYTQANDTKGPAAAAAGIGTPVAPGAPAAAATGTFLAGGPAAGAGYRPGPGSDNGAKLFQIRYVYTFSKRTEFNVGYVRLDNDTNAGYRLGGLGGTVRTGGNEDAWALSVRHTF